MDEQLVHKPMSAQEASQFQISTVFQLTLPAASLMMQNIQLVVATTPDATDSQRRALPLRIEPHPVPIQLIASNGFLLPDFNVNNKRSEYKACRIQTLEEVNGSTADPRFEVHRSVVDFGFSCFGKPDPVKRMRLWATHVKPCEYGQSYESWSDGYDVAATQLRLANLSQFLHFDICPKPRPEILSFLRSQPRWQSA